jgi:hypothetical protein
VIRFSPLILLAVAWCAAAQTGEVPLSKALWEWKREVERRSGGQVILVRVATDKAANTMSLPQGMKYRDVLTRYFRDENFVAQFYRSHATTVAYNGFEGTLFFVVLNMALAPQWEGVEDGVIAHELGHIDLLARGYPAWATGGGTDEQCLATQAGDAVQHVLIRDEMSRRKTAYFDYWRRNLDAVVRTMESGGETGPALDVCQKAARVALWTDVRMAFGDGKGWPRSAAFEQQMRKASPELKPLVDDIEKQLRQAAIWDKERYMAVLYDVLQTMQRLSRPLPMTRH